MSAKLDELDDFIRAAAAKGADFARIRTALSGAGWEASRIDSALGRYAETDLGVPAPKPRAFVSPRLFFMHCFYFVLLYVVAYNFISLLFTFLDHYLPDGLGQRGGFFYSGDPIRAIQDNLAALIVATPLFWLTEKGLERAQSRSGQAIPRIRLILAYFTIFVGACALLGDAIYFVYYLLRGELGLRFMLKTMILLLSVFGIWLYHRTDLSKDEAAS
ncbi:DUF5671 domain-containing protein [Neomegalonema perideroedes]|uniref:DUF5671 domain-containing protein n=1 Tax=Neomegalonema perideroedes TaxID=217219 RepID=UPI000360EE34|nr:DUF5671 domain-containing protein [Neomegalonema perideroedes]